VPAKAIEREIDVGHKTAWRMCNIIRIHLMAQEEDAYLEGRVEADETAYGGKPKASATRGMSMSDARGSKSRLVDAQVRATPTPSPSATTIRRVAPPEPRLLGLHQVRPTMHGLALPSLLGRMAVISVYNGQRNPGRGQSLLMLDRHRLVGSDEYYVLTKSLVEHPNKIAVQRALLLIRVDRERVSSATLQLRREALG
jgi:hypothetical protein